MVGALRGDRLAQFMTLGKQEKQRVVAPPLVIDQKREDETPEGIELTGDESEEVRPSFRINSGDLSFLKAIGIDPTRRVRRRR